MRNPNGYGCVVNLGKNRRKPFAVRLTTNFQLTYVDGKPKATQKYKYLGYYETRKEAMLALAKYNTNPFDLKLSNITFADVYAEWSKTRFPNGNDNSSAYRSYTAAFKKCTPLHNMKLRDIRTRNLQTLFTGNNSKSTLNNIKIVCNFVFEWGIKNDIIDKNYVDYVEIPKVEQTQKHKRFTTNEIDLLWKNIGTYAIDTALMLIYSGLRIGEFCNLTVNDVNLDEKYIKISKAKTKAGIRVVPIADRVLPLWQNWKPAELNKIAVSSNLVAGLADIGLNHLCHDTRYTCVSLLTAAGVQQEIVKKIVGHSGGNVTEDVYLHLELDTLLTAINKI